ncbi:MAG: hypothetical protein KDA49_11040 [Rhodospirillaceae bacterium]|nr:hypothetical protein [Rhodospirillaceae bacterium]MCA8932994.1 hypothetical protein [Rhodospirillaceae bacterium]
MVRSFGLWLVLAVVVLAGTPAPAPAQPAEEIQAAGGYAAGVTELIQRTAGYEQLLGRLDSLTYDVAEGLTGGAAARSSGDDLIARLRAELASIEADTEALPPVPALTDRGLTAQLASLRRFAVDGVETIAQSLDSSVELFEAAMAGDPDIFSELEMRGYDQTIEQLRIENAYLEEGRATIPEGAPERLLNGIVVKINEATIEALLAMRPMLADQPIDEAGVARTQSLLSEARQMIAMARVTVIRLTEQVEQMAPQSVAEANNRDLVLQVLDSYAQSFEVESGMVGQVDTMLAVARGEIGAEQREDLLSSLAGLIDQRLGLSAQRQRLAEGIQ